MTTETIHLPLGCLQGGLGFRIQVFRFRVKGAGYGRSAAASGSTPSNPPVQRILSSAHVSRPGSNHAIRSSSLNTDRIASPAREEMAPHVMTGVRVTAPLIRSAASCGGLTKVRGGVAGLLQRIRDPDASTSLAPPKHPCSPLVPRQRNALGLVGSRDVPGRSPATPRTRWPCRL